MTVNTEQMKAKAKDLLAELEISIASATSEEDIGEILHCIEKVTDKLSKLNDKAWEKSASLDDEY